MILCVCTKVGNTSYLLAKSLVTGLSGHVRNIFRLISNIIYLRFVAWPLAFMLHIFTSAYTVSRTLLQRDWQKRRGMTEGWRSCLSRTVFPSVLEVRRACSHCPPSLHHQSPLPDDAHKHKSIMFHCCYCFHCVLDSSKSYLM